MLPYRRFSCQLVNKIEEGSALVSILPASFGLPMPVFGPGCLKEHVAPEQGRAPKQFNMLDLLNPNRSGVSSSAKDRRLRRLRGSANSGSLLTILNNTQKC